MEQGPLTARSAALVQSSWTLLRPVADQVADRFFCRVFSQAPDIAAFFPAGNTPAQRARLLSRVEMVVNALDRLEEIRTALEIQGQYYARRGARDLHYETLRSHWLRTIFEQLGEELSLEGRRAWSAASSRAIAIMTAPIRVSDDDGAGVGSGAIGDSRD